MINVLKKSQIFLAVMVILLCWITFPGIMALLISVIGFCYLAITIGAVKDNRFFIWLSIISTISISLFTFRVIKRLLDHGYSVFVIDIESFVIFDLSPHLFLIVFLISIILLVMYLFSWKWVINRNT